MEAKILVNGQNLEIGISQNPPGQPLLFLLFSSSRRCLFTEKSNFSRVQTMSHNNTKEVYVRWLVQNLK